MLTILVFLLNVAVLYCVFEVVLWIVCQLVAIPANILKIIRVILVLLILIWAIEALSGAGSGLLFTPHWR